MFEVEVKVPADHERVRRELDSVDATYKNAVAQEDTYYDAPHRDFAETDEALRVREQASLPKDVNVAAERTANVLEESTVRVTYKGPLVDAESKTREEHETEVGSGAEMRAILEGVGFVEAARVAKVREYYRYGGVTVTLDDVRDLGEFVEVELEVESEARVPDARERAYDVIRDLDLDPDDQIRTSYLGLLLQ